MTRRWGEVVARHALAVLMLSLVVVIGAGAYGAGVFDRLGNGGFEDPHSQSSRELAVAQDTFGIHSLDVIAIYSSDTLTVTSPRFRDAVQQVLRDIPEGTTAEVTSYYDTLGRDLVSRDRHATRVLISLAGTTQDDLADSYDRLRPALQSSTLRTDLAGSWAVYDDVNKISKQDLSRAEAYSLPIVLVLSLLIFGSVLAALMPVIVGISAVLGALAVVKLVTLVSDVSVFSVNVITLLGLGLAIDYALFVITRFREELAALPVDDPQAPATAIRATMGTAGRTVLFSGLTVAAAMSSLLVFPQGFFHSIGYGGIAAVVVAMVSALTLLPAVLRLLGRRIDSGRLPWRRASGSHLPTSGGAAWARLAHSVMRRPVVYVVVITGTLLLVASPFLGVRWGSVDSRVLPADAPAAVAAHKLDTTFGPETSSAELLLRGASRADVAEYTRGVRAVPGVVDVRRVAHRDQTTLLRASWHGNSQTAASQRLVGALRTVEPPHGTVLVGGLTASTVDLVDSIGAHLPWMALIVVGVMLVLLFLAFGSVVLPVKAVLMNALSISASFGVVTAIFADGHLAGLLGFTSPGYLDATQPILMLAILFGLSMDYEVFLLSRIREQWDHGHDNTQAVALGLQRTGRIITSAALLLAVVIGAFATSGIVFLKMIGVGMLVALLVDATVVRALLVPATMKLLGGANWWAPGPLRRFWERHGLTEHDEQPAPTAGEAVTV